MVVKQDREFNFFKNGLFGLVIIKAYKLFFLGFSFWKSKQGRGRGTMETFALGMDSKDK
jgi:hypothetical protein